MISAEVKDFAGILGRAPFSQVLLLPQRSTSHFHMGITSIEILNYLIQQHKKR